MEVLALTHRYAVFQYVNGVAKRVGVVTANNHSYATTKAMRLFSRHVWVERILTGTPSNAA